MLKRKTLLLFICCVTSCFYATPAKADLFGFTLSNLSHTFNGSSYSATDWMSGGQGTTGSLYRNIAPTGTAYFNATSWGTGPKAFSLLMTISNITANMAEGVGGITFFDVDGDFISANVAGDWMKIGASAVFWGTLSNVYYNEVVNTTFDGHSGENVSMEFPSSEPWDGTIVELTCSGGWFDKVYTNIHGGSVDASVVSVPAPAGVLLGILGLGVVGIKLRKYA